MPGYVIPIMLIALVAAAIGAVVFIIFRLQSGQGLNISWGAPCSWSISI